MQLFCFPHAGAGPSQFRNWRPDASDDLTIVPVALPGREQRFAETMPRELDALVDDVFERIAPRLDRPFAFFGHSLGALLAFELARRLRRKRLRLPQRLFVSAFRAPHLTERRAPLRRASEAVLKIELQRLGGTPRAVLDQPELMQTLLPALRGDMELVDGYKHRAGLPLPCPITCLSGLQDQRVSRPELEAWQRHTTDEFRLRLFPGAHFYLYEMPTLVLHAVCADLRLARSTVTATHGSTPMAAPLC